MEADLKNLYESYTLSKGVVMEGFPEAKTVLLKVGPQSFIVGEAENNEEAEWLREMLAKALSVIIKEVTK